MQGSMHENHGWETDLLNTIYEPNLSAGTVLGQTVGGAYRAGSVEL